MCKMYVAFISAPSGWICISPKENSCKSAPFHCSSQPARSNILPSAVTPVNVGERCRSTLAQSLSWIACHIRRSCCSAPVAFFQVGCFGSPAQPDKKIQSPTTKDHKDRHCLLVFGVGSIRSSHSIKDSKRAQRI